MPGDQRTRQARHCEHPCAGFGNRDECKVVRLEGETATCRYHNPRGAYAGIREEVYVRSVPGTEGDAKVIMQILACKGTDLRCAVEKNDGIEGVGASSVKTEVDDWLGKVNGQIAACRGGIGERRRITCDVRGNRCANE